MIIYHMRSLLLMLLVIATFGLAAQSQASTGKLQVAAPETVGMSATQLQHIDALCQTYFENDWLPGGTVLVARKGKIVYFNTWGERDQATNTPYRKDDIFRIASMTKAFVSVAILQLLEQGKFTLDDPVSKYIPAFKNMQVVETYNREDTSYTTVPAKQSITIRHLLTHTSGLPYPFMNAQMAAIYQKNGAIGFGLGTGQTTKSVIENLAEQPLLHHPGEGWTYGYNTDVLGYLVEVISGQNLGDYARKQIFEPLGMDDTYFYIPQAKGERLVPVYYDTQSDEGLQQYPADAQNYPLKAPTNYYSGGGGASSTTMDYAIFCQMLLNKGTYNGKRILGRKTVELMAMDQLAYMDIEPGSLLGTTGRSFGLGFFLTTEKVAPQSLQSAGTYGWSGIFNTKYWIDPKEELIFVGMTQILPDYHPEFWTKLYGIIYGAVGE